MLKRLMAALAVSAAVAAGAAGMAASKGVQIERMYLDDSSSLVISADDPYKEQIEEKLLLLETKPPAKRYGTDIPPFITAKMKNGDVYKLGYSIEHAARPDVEDYEGDEEDFTVLYVRCNDATAHYELDTDINELCRLADKAKVYEYTKMGTFTGTVGYTGSDSSVKRCNIYSDKYGYISMEMDDLNGVIIGDMAEVTITGTNGRYFTGTVKNITHGNITENTEGSVKCLPFEYEILRFDGCENCFKHDDMETEKENFDFLLDMFSDRMPAKLIQSLKDKYSEEFFENNVIIYKNLKDCGASVTAAAQTNITGAGNILYMKRDENTGPGIVIVSIPRAEWNGKVFSIYIY